MCVCVCGGVDEGGGVGLHKVVTNLNCNELIEWYTWIVETTSIMVWSRQVGKGIEPKDTKYWRKGDSSWGRGD